MTNPLTEEEFNHLQAVVKEIELMKHRCHVNSQRMTMHSDGRILYHEGAVKGWAHAWNSINGKLIDVSSPYSQVVPTEGYSLYDCKASFTQEQVLANLVKNGVVWSWITNPAELGKLKGE